MAQILVVDDEVGIRELLSEILADEGHQVLLAENAGAARRLRAPLPACASGRRHLAPCSCASPLHPWAPGRAARSAGRKGKQAGMGQ